MSLPRCVLPNQTYLITRRCLGRRFLLRPDEALNNAFLYCLTLAAKKHGVAVHALCAMSNHYHLVTHRHRKGCSRTSWPGSTGSWRCASSDFAAGTRWCGSPTWHYSAVELGGPAEVLDKIAYVLLNPVSAALVRSAERWLGAVSTLEILATRHDARPSALTSGSRTTRHEEVSLALSVPPCLSDRGELPSSAAGTCSEAAFVRCVPSSVAKGGATSAASVCEGRAVDRPAAHQEAAFRSQSDLFCVDPCGVASPQSKRLRAFRLAYRVAYQGVAQRGRGASSSRWAPGGSFATPERLRRRSKHRPRFNR